MSNASAYWNVIRALSRRGLNEIIRVPGASVPGALAPTIFMLGTYSIFGKLATLPGFAGSDYLSFIIPVGLLQSAAFTGAATGVNMARDIEDGWFDRLLLVPVPRWVILVGIVASAAFRTMLPASLLLTIGFILGLNWPGIVGLLLALALVAALASAMAFWASALALKFKSQDAAPLMQSTGFVLVFFSPAYAPMALLAGWLKSIAQINPVTYVLEGVRQGFVAEVTWYQSWLALVCVFGLVIFFSVMAARNMQRTSV